MGKDSNKEGRGKMKRTILLTLTAATLTLAACERDYSLARPQFVPRADLDLVPVPAAPGAGAPFDMGPSSTPRMWEQDVVRGTYTFTTPKNVTNIKQNVGEIAQYKLYLGEPAPTDHPFVSITVAPTVESQASAGAGDLKAERERTYLLNGMTCQEWTGHTSAGLPFCELIVAHGEGGEKLHALAIAKDADSRKLALDILASITWTPSKK